MIHHTDSYINACLRVGILTSKKIRKYPLRANNLAVVLKMYALTSKLPFQFDNMNVGTYVPDSKYTLTDSGLSWLFTLFQQYSFEYMQSVLGILLIDADETALKYPEAYEGFNNFKGITGRKTRRGSKNPALVVHYYHKNRDLKKEYRFNSLAEARDYLFDVFKFYPVSDFRLFRLRETPKGSFREEVPTVLEQSATRGQGLRNYLKEKYQ